MKSLLYLLGAVLLLPIIIDAEEYPLIQEGKSLCAIVRTPQSSSSDIFACRELAAYLKKITGSEVRIVRRPVPGKYNIYPGWLGNRRYRLPAQARKLTEQIRDDGFTLYADAAGLYITAKAPRGVLYGVYEVLKRCGDIRWIFPGPDGEFFTPKKNIAIPAFRETVNPSFSIRRFNLIAVGQAWETPLWQVRNNMHPWGSRYPQLAPDIDGGGHIFSLLMPDTYFSTRPELYGLYNGRRLPQCGNPDAVKNNPTGGQHNQPCTSNPETVRIMCDNLVKYLQAHPEFKYLKISNNDSPKWCECENCRKLDPPEERRNNQVATRYWILLNQLTAAAKKVRPDVKIIGTAYQNRHDYPLGTDISPDLIINLSPNNRCYTHHMFDTTCVHNRRFRNALLNFEKTGNPITVYEYMNFLPCGSGGYYMPLGRFIARELKDYHRHGYAGWCDEVLPCDGTFIPNRNSHAWQKNILDEYIKAYFMWNVQADYDAVEDDIGSRYYGPAWPAMKEYRRFLSETYENLNDHLCMGSLPASQGRALERPGAEAKLEGLLKKALELSAADRRVTALLEEERRVFRGTFVENHRLYQKQNRNSGIAAARKGDGLACGVKYADYAPEIPMELRFLYDDRGFYPVHGDGGAGAELEISAAGKTLTYNVEKAGEKFFALPGLTAGGTLPVSVLFRRDGRTFSWNGADAVSGPERFRLLVLGNKAVIPNGSFEKWTLKDKQYILKDIPSNAEVIQGDAAAGRCFIRGVHISCALEGLNGYLQTYVPPNPFREKLRFSAMVRGNGQLNINLKDSLVPTGLKGAGLLKQIIPVSSRTWQPVQWTMDCSSFKGLRPYLILHFQGLDLDCLNASVLKSGE